MALPGLADRTGLEPTRSASPSRLRRARLIVVVDGGAAAGRDARRSVADQAHFAPSREIALDGIAGADFRMRSTASAHAHGAGRERRCLDMRSARHAQVELVGLA